MKRFLLPLLLLLLCAEAAFAQLKVKPGNTAIYFPFNKYFLADSAKARIDELIYSNAINDRNTLSIVGYADFVGGEDYNLSLSRKRADAVKTYLIASGFRPEAITIIIGKGRVERRGMHGSSGFAPDRRVDIIHEAQKTAAAPVAQQRMKTDTIHRAEKFNAAINIATIETGQTLLLDNIFFYAGRHVIRPESLPALMLLYNTLEENPTLKIRIEGHVCCIRPGIPDALDEDTGGLVLSTNRARAIRAWLLKKGIDEARLTYKGFGKSRPVIPDETTEEEADRNRRVEIRIMEK